MDFFSSKENIMFVAFVLSMFSFVIAALYMKQGKENML